MKKLFIDLLREIYWFGLLGPIAMLMHRMRCEPKTFARVFGCLPRSGQVTLWHYKRINGYPVD